MRLPDYWEPSDNIEDRRRTPNPEHQQLIRERRLGSIYDQADDADARQGIRLDDGNGGVYDPNAPKTLMGGLPVDDPFQGTNSPLKFLERLGPMATPELGMLILQDPQRAIEMLAGRGIPLMHSDFGASEFPPSPSYPPPQEPVKGPGGSTVPSEAPGSRPGLGAPPPAPPTTREPLPPPVQDRPPVAPPMAGSPPSPPSAPQPAPEQRPPMAPPPDWGQVGNNIKDWFSPTPGAPPAPLVPATPTAPPPVSTSTPTPPPGAPATGNWWDGWGDTLRTGARTVGNALVPGMGTITDKMLTRPGPTSYGGMDPQDYNTPAPSAPSSVPYNGMDPQDYNTPGPSPFDPTPADQPPLDITAAAGKAPAAKPAANGIAAMLSGLKPIETKANVPATPSAPHPTAGNSTNLADLIAMMTSGHKAASTPLDGLGLLLARGKL